MGSVPGDGAFNDCNIVGFDCSGLAMYAWAQLPVSALRAHRNTARQGSYHPVPETCCPATWSSGVPTARVAGIHHVAIYIGGGNVIQAPQSGAVIQVTPLDQV